MNTTHTDSVTIGCPTCGTTHQVEPVTVVHENSPEQELLFESKLNLVNCESCEHGFLYETPLLFRSEDGKYLIYFMPDSGGAEQKEMLQNMEELYGSVFSDLPEAERPDCRLESSRGRFLEKIAIYQHGHDDRLIEYIKYQLYQHSKELDAVRHELYYDFGNSDDENISFIALDRETHEAVYAMNFDYSGYQELVTLFLYREDNELNQLFPSHRVVVDDLL